MPCANSLSRRSKAYISAKFGVSQVTIFQHTLISAAFLLFDISIDLSTFARTASLTTFGRIGWGAGASVGCMATIRLEQLLCIFFQIRTACYHMLTLLNWGTMPDRLLKVEFIGGFEGRFLDFYISNIFPTPSKCLLKPFYMPYSPPQAFDFVYGKYLAGVQSISQKAD